MKYFAVVLCILVGSASAVPLQTSHASVFDLLERLEDFVEQEGHLLLEKVVDVIHKVESAVLEVKDSVPKVYEKIHQEADEILAQLKKVMDEIEEVLGKKDVAYGFDLLGELTELTGGTKLSTVLRLMSLAEKAHRVVEDARDFVPHFEKTFNRIQEKLSDSLTDLAEHVLKELGLQEAVARSVVGKIEDLVELVEEQAHLLILDLFQKIEATFDIVKEHLPELYKKVEHSVEEIREQMHDILQDIEKTFHINGYSLLDVAGSLTSGTSLGTVIKVMSVIEKFNVVVQDIRGFGPRVEILLEHTVKKVAESAQDFFTHTANLLNG